MTSPLRVMTTLSPILKSFSLTIPMLCRVARVMVTFCGVQSDKAASDEQAAFIPPDMRNHVRYKQVTTPCQQQYKAWS